MPNLFKIIAIFILTALSLPSGKISAQKASKPIRIVGDWKYPPYEYLNEDGKPEGFIIDLLKEIMSDLNWNYHITLTNFTDAVHQIDTNQAQLLTGYAYSDQRAQDYNFSLTHSFIYQSIICRKGSPVYSLNDLKGKKVIFQTGEISQKIIQGMGIHCDTLFYDNMQDGLQVLANGVGDAAVCGHEIADFIIQQKKLRNLEIRTITMAPFEYCFASNKEQRELMNRINESIARLKASGRYDEIYAKWFKNDIFIIHPYVYLLILVCIALIAITVGFNLLLRKKIRAVEKKNEEANRELKIASDKYETLYRRYDLILKTMPVGVEIYDKNGYQLFINEKDAEIFGVPDINELLKNPICFYNNPIISDELKQQLHEGKDIDIDISFDFDKVIEEKYYDAQHKEKKVIHGQSRTIRNKDGEIENYVFVLSDISEQYHYEERLKEASAKWEYLFKEKQEILDAMPIGMAIFDREGNLNSLNPATSAIFGLTDQNKYLSQNIFDNPIVTEEFRKWVTSGQPVEKVSRFHYVTEQGEERSLYIHILLRAIYKENHEIESFLLMIQDVTLSQTWTQQLEQTQQHLNLAVDAAELRVSYYEPDTESFYCLRDGKFIYEPHLSMEKIISQAHEEDQACYRKSLQQLLSGEIEHLHHIFRLFSQQYQEYRHIEINFIATRNQSGRVYRLSGAQKDVTQQQRLLLDLEKAKDKAEEANRLKSAFLANMSHEIRTPLNAIVGFSEMLTETLEPEEKEEYVQIIQKNNELLLRLIEDILDLSKIEAGTVDLRINRFNLSKSFEMIGTVLKQRIKNPNVEFIIENPCADCWVTLDEKRLNQIISNFVNNAIKFTQEGFIKIGYELVDNGIRFYCSDSGIGIPEDKIRHIFDRFYKVNEFAQGTGLGMAICKALVEAQHGKIGVHSQEGEGSIFWCWFPCVNEEPA